MDQEEYISHKGAMPLELVDFVVSHMPNYRGKERDIYKVVKKSLEYETVDYGIDKKGLLYVLRINIDEDGFEAEIDDLIIRERYTHGYKLIKYIIARNWSKFPYLKSIRFYRLNKYPERDKKEYRLIKFFNKGEKSGWENNNTTSSPTSTTDSSPVSKRVRSGSSDDTVHSA
jgi:hypothetical protein